MVKGGCMSTPTSMPVLNTQVCKKSLLILILAPCRLSTFGLCGCNVSAPPTYTLTTAPSLQQSYTYVYIYTHIYIYIYMLLIKDIAQLKCNCNVEGLLQAAGCSQPKEPVGQRFEATSLPGAILWALLFGVYITGP